MIELETLKKIGGAALLVATVNAVNVASAADIQGYPDSVDAYDPREVAMLPQYCKFTQLFRDKVPGGNNVQEIEHWYATLGPIFHSLHHYCYGLMRTNRANLLAKTQQLRTFYLSSAIGEFDYVIERSSDDFVLLPEILTKKGENLVRLGKGALGIIELERAIELKRDYWPPYAVLSDYYKSIGERGKAREILEQGIVLAHEPKALTNRLGELDNTKAKK